jgi:hypothetical protein
MSTYISIGYVAMATIIIFGLLYTTDFFMSEERQYSQSEPYVVGATAPTMVMWEMY